ncbi:MAG: A/G-specific adenine glycosylase [Burkholderiales bacterium]
MTRRIGADAASNMRGTDKSRIGVAGKPQAIKTDGEFARQIIQWQKKFGRQDLPWQNTRDAYRIWLSEVMLQQTQVATVIPYYHRFLERFPDVISLARASQDEVLALWSGLGYYSRGRNLHKAARRVAALGAFPDSQATLAELEGVGRSTAAAIAVFSAGKREAILDGNVKRVLARHFAIEGSPGVRAVDQRLWDLAESLLPATGIESYTQGLMDMGATLCLRSKPRCSDCPVRGTCEAFAMNRVADFPGKKAKKTLPHKNTVMPICLHQGKVLLIRRPEQGIWGGMFCFPEFESVAAALSGIRQKHGYEPGKERALAPLKHGFTHFSLEIYAFVCEVQKISTRTEEPGSAWFSIKEALKASIPTPVRKLLLQVG